MNRVFVRLLEAAKKCKQTGKRAKLFLRERKDLHRFKRELNEKPLKIVIGAGQLRPQGWIATEKEYLNILHPEEWAKYFSLETVEAILSEHVWEHLAAEEGLKAAKNCYQYLMKGGYVRVAVPDGFHPDPNYIEWVKPSGIGRGAETHEVLYNYKSLSELFEKAKFKVMLYEYYDEEGNFVFQEFDPNDGKIFRSKRWVNTGEVDMLYNRVTGKNNFSSIVLDAIKCSEE